MGQQPNFKRERVRKTEKGTRSGATWQLPVRFLAAPSFFSLGGRATLISSIAQCPTHVPLAARSGGSCCVDHINPAFSFRHLPQNFHLACIKVRVALSLTLIGRLFRIPQLVPLSSALSRVPRCWALPLPSAPPRRACSVCSPRPPTPARRRLLSPAASPLPLGALRIILLFLHQR